MQVFEYPQKEEWADLLKRPENDLSGLFNKVQTILDEIKKDGDTAVRKYSEKFDGYAAEEILVSKSEIDEASLNVSSQLKEAIYKAKLNVEKFHEAQIIPERVVETMPGVVCRQKCVPIEKVGLYIPGGTAPLFSTVLMLAVPAKIAKCKEIVLCTPPGKDGKINPAILYTASLVGVTKIYKIGGVQAIGSMAYGTDTVPKVDKIFGPGNSFVTAAKQLVSLKDVAIDMPAGPSEVEVLADDSANPAFIASDLLSQAEHGVDSQVILITNSKTLISEVQIELRNQLDLLPRKEIASKALDNSRIILLNETAEMIEMTNSYAPEHLIIAMKDEDSIADQITNAGSVFVGNYTPESAGDYASGTNHTLPTHGYAKAYSGVNLDSYLKKITFQKISPNGLKIIGPSIEQMAGEEQLHAHKNAVTIRLKSLE
ncbi:histidinol dehydrogenase [Plebeiibacterium sediminum]|uniref:Histidinol dehydrogenase n=1 Tax=Plebeiibacterium sediminum TaxID=2992112 RepID=A0AAE3M0P4_9BACT|nr:histidinol dehydrogenase [Plebeiobacterium sediminum]MCW3785036.1 histidinol dehydrogenase [Plebeiobacterium sediminum]